jgi:hypothetical protein
MMCVNSKLIPRFYQLLSLLLLCSCGQPSTQQAPSPLEGRKPQQISEKTQPPDPTSSWREEVKKAWSLFIKDSHYRVAQPQDFRFPKTDGSNAETAFDKYANRPWIAWWGAFAVIVVDNTRTDQDRFGLILFVEPKENWKLPEDKKKPWKSAWLYRNRDLSRTWMEQASGYWLVFELGEDGTRRGCEVDWSKRQKKYVCS